MKSSMKCATMLLTCALFFCVQVNPIFSEDRTGKYGIGVIASGSSPDLLFKLWLGPSLSVQPAVGFTILSPKKGDTVSNYRIGLGLLGYKNGQLSSYYGVRAAANILSGGGESDRDIFVSAVLGAEYFFSEKFSIGGEFQLGVGIADDDFSPSGLSFGSKNYFTGQFATFNFYFK